MLGLIYLGLVLFLPQRKRAGLVPIPKNKKSKKGRGERGGKGPPLVTTFPFPPPFVQKKGPGCHGLH